MRNLFVVVSMFGLSGCFAFMTKDEGRTMQQQIEDVKNQSAKNETRAAELAKQMDTQLARLKKIVDEATKVVTRNSADVGQTVEKMQVDLGQIQGRLDDLQHTSDALTKQFQDYRANSDTKLEQLTNATTASKAPPVPDTPDGAFGEGEKKLAAQQWVDARRLFEAFVNRYPADPRAATAHSTIGAAYDGEKRFANAIGAYTKVVDNFPKSEVVPDAMFKNGMAFFQLKYCSDAKVYFQELLKRYPKTGWKKDASDQLKNLQRDSKNKALCAS
jgi:tol-pal system protein YbgF